MRQARCPYCGALQLDGRCPKLDCPGSRPPVAPDVVTGSLLGAQAGGQGYQAPTRPTIPPYSEPTTSRDAALSMVEAAAAQEVLVYGAIGDGRTCDALEVELHLPHQSCSARLNGLERRGLVRKGPRKAPTRSGRLAWVYEVTA